MFIEGNRLYVTEKTLKKFFSDFPIKNLHFQLYFENGMDKIGISFSGEGLKAHFDHSIGYYVIIKNKIDGRINYNCICDVADRCLMATRKRKQ